MSLENWVWLNIIQILNYLINILKLTYVTFHYFYTQVILDKSINYIFLAF